MTCIVGIATKTGTLIAGDSLASNWYTQTRRTDRKVFKLGDHVAVGFTSSYRMGQIIRYHVTAPSLRDAEGEWIDAFEYAVKYLIPEVRTRLKEHGFTKVENSVEEGGRFVLGIRDRVFIVDSDFQVGESTDGYVAAGSGEEVALGVLYHTRAEKDSAAERAEAAIRAAEYHSRGVGGPIETEETT